MQLAIVGINDIIIKCLGLSFLISDKSGTLMDTYI